MRNLWLRAAMLRAIRQFFEQRDYLEVDTPLLIPAPAPEPHLLPQRAGKWFLQTSPELGMKRLLARGIPRIYQICKCFRRQERGRRHLPEFTMLEWYRVGADYRDLMAECEALLPAVAAALAGAVKDDPADAAGHGAKEAGSTLAGPDGVSLEPPWQRLTVAEAFRRYAGLEVQEALRREQFEQLLVEKIEPRLGRQRPTFLYDYPAELGALARLSPQNPAVAERFELYIAGIELANGFSELIDPSEQRRRFARDRAAIRAAGRRPSPLPRRFLEELHAMPPAAGIALGIDRLAMFFTGAESIDQVQALTPEQL
ncbi:MAG: EF-P lysine aminoacylase EpmA [Desulfurivibrio sp.]|nr:EF-P lysine aminoacylase EpmA [Desulfurivibrio sp.]